MTRVDGLTLMKEHLEGVSWTGLSSPWVGPTVAGDAFGVVLFNTGPIRADGTVRSLVISNDTGRRLLIAATDLWIGVDWNHQCDAQSMVSRNDGSILALFQCDHYNQDSKGNTKQIVHPRPFILDPGGLLAMTYFANPFGGPFNVHFTAWVQGYYA